jgi:hypothetical protein
VELYVILEVAMINVNSLCSLCAVGEKMKKKIAHNVMRLKNSLGLVALGRQAETR